MYNPSRAERELQTYKINSDGVIGETPLNLRHSGSTGNGTDKNILQLSIKSTVAQANNKLLTTHLFNIMNNEITSNNPLSKYSKSISQLREKIKKKYIELSQEPPGNREKTMGDLIQKEINENKDLQDVFTEISNEVGIRMVMNFGIGKNGEIYFGFNKISLDHISKAKELIGERNAMVGRENDFNAQCAEIALKAQAGEELNNCVVYSFQFINLNVSKIPPCTACRERVTFYGWLAPDSVP